MYPVWLERDGAVWLPRIEVEDLKPLVDGFAKAAFASATRSTLNSRTYVALVPRSNCAGLCNEATLETWVVQTAALSMLRRVNECLGSSALLVPMKGVLLARTHYSDIATRPITDCDVLVTSPSFSRSLALLVSAGFRRASTDRVSSVATMSHPLLGGISLDLHGRPLPLGIGRVSTRWFLVGAQLDTRRWGVPVLVPREDRIFVQLVGNQLKDAFRHAEPHHVEDLVRVLRARTLPLESFASAVREARLTVGTWAALEWSRRRRTDVQEIVHLQQLLALTERERQRAQRRLALIERLTKKQTLTLRERIVNRCVSDSAVDCVVGLAAAAEGAVGSRIRTYRSPPTDGAEADPSRAYAPPT